MPIPFHNSQYLISKSLKFQEEAWILCISVMALC